MTDSPKEFAVELGGLLLTFDNATVIDYLDDPNWNHIEYAHERGITGIIPAIGSSVIRQMVKVGWPTAIFERPDDLTKDWFCSVVASRLDEEWADLQSWLSE